MVQMMVNAAHYEPFHPDNTDELIEARFSGDTEGFKALCADEGISRALQRTEVLRQKSRLRMRLLSHAVRVQASLIPHVARSLDRVAQLVRPTKPLEAYVFDDPMVNAFVAEGRRRYLVAISSGAVQKLRADELEFVIGHELGHVIFGHLAIAADALIDFEMVNIGQCMALRAWQRASEISADRVGFLCCDSIEIAASALFKSICGLALPGMRIAPDEFARQWDGLAEEMVEHGERDYWKLPHPFPPLRMQALLLFAAGGDRRRADRRIQRLLAHMDGPRGVSKDGRDPLLSHFNFWGSLYVSLADRRFDRELLGELGELAPPGSNAVELLARHHASEQVPALCLARFRQARSTRRQKLSAAELHSLLAGFVDLALSRGPVSERGIEHLTNLGRELGIAAGAVHLIIDKKRTKDS